MNEKCIIYGCNNKKNQGNFIGNLCVPCYEMITTGEIKYGYTFIHEINREKCRLEQIIEKLTDTLEEYVK
jgi:hypothetical protein